MKVYNLKRGHGKTTRLIFISEFTGAPILCLDANHKKLIQDIAEQNDAKIPAPITLNDLSRMAGTSCTNDYLIDEAPLVLKALVERASNGKLSNLMAITLSESNSQ